MVEIEEQPAEESPNLVEEKTNEDEEEERVGSWRELMGKDLRMKVLSEATGSAKPAQNCDVGDAVLVDIVGYCASNVNSDDWEKGPEFQDSKDWLVIVVDKDVTPALELGIRFLREGERAVIQSHPKYAYGPAGRKHGDYVLPPHSHVIYHVHIKSVVDAESEKFSTPAFQIECALNKKMIGNDCYQNEWSDGYGKSKAQQLYRKGAEAMKKVLEITEDEKEEKQAREVLLDCLNNVAAVHMRAKQYGMAKEAATQVLMYDSRNLKGLCRAARAAMLDPAGTYEESEAAIAAAETEYGDDADVKKLRAEFARRKNDYNKKSKAMFSKMAKAMQSEATEKDETVTKKEQVEKEATKEGSSEDPTEDTRPYWKRNARQLTIHAIIMLIQIILYFYLRGRYPNVLSDGVTVPEKPSQLDQNPDQEF